MPCSLTFQRSACRPVAHATAQRMAVLNRPVRCFICCAQTQRQQQAVADTANSVDTVAISLAALLAQPLAAYADESAIEAAASAPAAAAEAAANTVDAPAWLGYVLLLSPIIIYALFNVYRSQVNPRAKFTDFLFVCAGVAVIANLVSILAFRIRLF